MGLVVGDALGVPVEFTSRQEREQDPVVNMRAYGSHGQPAGTWSDDSSKVVKNMHGSTTFIHEQYRYGVLREG